MGKLLIKHISLKLASNINLLVFVGIVLGRYVEAFTIFAVSLFIILKGHKIAISKVFIPFIVIIITSIPLIYINSYNYSKFIQQFVFIFIVTFSYVQYFERGKPDIQSLFNMYIKVMYVVCILGLIQFVVFFVLRIDIFPFSLDGYIQKIPNDRILRIHSIFNEAGNLGTCLVPVIAYMLFKKDFFNENKKQSIIILVTYLLTLATVSYVLLFMLLIVKFYSKLSRLKYLFAIILLILAPISFSIFSSSSQDIDKSDNGFFVMMQRKIIETSTFTELEDPEAFELLNASSYASLTNLWIAINAPSRLIGTGLGTHQENYQKLYPENDYPLYGLNSIDGYSLFVRILSEFGIIGICLYLFFIIKCFNNKNIINKSVLFLLLALCVRGGHYTFYGTIFFHLIYFYTSKKEINEENN